MEGITWWDLSDGGWLNAPGGLIRRDGSSKPAYDELLKLVKGEWWSSPAKWATDQNGEIRFKGVPGEYEMMFHEIRRPFSMTAGDATAIEIRL